ncbi:uncharacterized protein LOC128672284 [Plodia interpunctella]|uniref:uncharacterized protein LOC128672284 n=1 Tax=Plodia interpunctella TaxID=58824 RepID=UPI0023682B83|nr:uncharacterized protein LOC128672284 [Plodia interpunctella]
MLRKLIALSVVFGMVFADPLTDRLRDRMNNANALDFLEERTESEDLLVQLLPEKAQLIIQLVNAVIGVKVSAISIAVNVIGWLVSNAAVIIVGVLGALGFCKYTGKCALDYDVAQLRSYATPENLDTAQNFLFTAVERYAESNGRSM